MTCMQGSIYEDFSPVDTLPQEPGCEATDFIKEDGTYDKDEMADKQRDRIANGEIVACKECNIGVHNPYFKRCWNCNQRLLNRTKAAEMGNDDGIDQDSLANPR